jgi:hypothetical protein
LPIHVINQTSHRSLEKELELEQNGYIGTLKIYGSLSIHIINQTSHRSLEEELGLEENSICTKKKTNEKEKRKRTRKNKMRK